MRFRPTEQISTETELLGATVFETNQFDGGERLKGVSRREYSLVWPIRGRAAGLGYGF